MTGGLSFLGIFDWGFIKMGGHPFCDNGNGSEKKSRSSVPSSRTCLVGTFSKRCHVFKRYVSQVLLLTIQQTQASTNTVIYHDTVSVVLSWSHFETLVRVSLETGAVSW